MKMPRQEVSNTHSHYPIIAHRHPISHAPAGVACRVYFCEEPPPPKREGEGEEEEGEKRGIIFLGILEFSSG